MAPNYSADIYLGIVLAVLVGIAAGMGGYFGGLSAGVTQCERAHDGAKR